MSEDGVGGHCNCGGVRFELTAPLTLAGYCHCTRCQRRTGAGASAQAPVERGHLRFLAGEELLRAWQHPDGGYLKLFCSECGSHLFSRSPDDPDQMSVRLGVLDGDPGVRPSFHQFCENAAAWEPIPEDGLPRFPGSRSAGL